MCNKDSKKTVSRISLIQVASLKKLMAKLLLHRTYHCQEIVYLKGLMADHFLSKFANKMRGPTPVSGQTHMHKAIFRDYL
jgi:hypothetical protein